MRVFVEPSPGLPLLTITLAFEGGSVHDPANRGGLARVVARTLRRGAAGLSLDDLEERIDRLGGEIAVDASLSVTMIHAEVIARNVVPFVELLAKVISQPSFEQEELDRQIREQAAEIVDARDSDRSLAGRAFRRALFGEHPYGRRVSGSIDSIASIERSDVLGFYERHYTRKGASLALSGSVTEVQGLMIAEQLLSSLPEGEALSDVVPEPVAPKGRHLVVVQRPDRTQVQLILGALGNTPRDPDHIAWTVANTAFGGTFTSWLMQEVRAKRGWSYGASSRIGYDRKRDAFSISSAPSAADAAPCLQLLIELSGKAKRDGLSAEELAFVKNYLVRSHAFEIDTARKRVAQRLEEAIFDLPLGQHAHFVARVEAVTLDEVNEALARRMPFEDFVVGAVASKKGAHEALLKAVPQWDSVTVHKPDFE